MLSLKKWESLLRMIKQLVPFQHVNLWSRDSVWSVAHSLDSTFTWLWQIWLKKTKNKQTPEQTKTKTGRLEWQKGMWANTKVINFIHYLSFTP